MNIVEYAIAFKDTASAPLNRFVGNISRSIATARQFTDRVVTLNGAYKQSYSQLDTRIKEVEDRIRNSTIKSEIRAAKRELEGLQRQASKHKGGLSSSGSDGGGFSVGSMMKGMLGAGAIMGAAQQVGQFFAGSIADSMERQQTQTSFNVLTGSEEKGSALTSQLVALQKDTILGKEVFQNAQTMLGFGFKDTEVLDNMKMLGDVSMGNTEKFQSLTLAFSQIRAGGKLTGQDLLQLINAGFNPLEQMSYKTGKSMGQLKDEMSKGNISFADVQQSFKDATSEGGRFNNMLETIAQTPAGKMKQLEGAWGEFKIAAGGAMEPLVTMALDFGNKMLPIIEQIIPPLQRVVQRVANFFRELTSGTSEWQGYIDTVKNIVVEHLWPTLKKTAATVFNMVGKWVEFVKNSQLIKGIFSVIGDIAKVIFDVTNALIDSLVWVFNNVVMPILNGIEKAYRWIKGGSSASSTAAPSTRQQEEQKEQEQKQGDLLSDIAKNTADNKTAAGEAEKSISSGGQKVINITVQKFFDYFTIQTNNLQESEADIEQRMLEMFGRVLVQGATATQ